MIESANIHELARAIADSAEYRTADVFAEANVIDGHHYLSFMIWRDATTKERIGRLTRPIDTADDLREVCKIAREIFDAEHIHSGI